MRQLLGVAILSGACALGVDARQASSQTASSQTASSQTEKLPADVIQGAIDESVLNRLSEPEEVAAAVLFLLSDMARQITGETLRVDAGQYI